MKYYYDYLTDNGFKVKYISLQNKFNLKEYFLFDPIDKIKLPGKHEIIETPNFILTKDIYKQYREKTDKFFFYFFYMWGKKQINVLPNVKSKDKENRLKFDDDINYPKIYSNKSDEDYISKGIKYCKKYFPKNLGNTNNFIFPVTHKTAKKWLSSFIQTRLNNFGKYEDAISKDENYLFHSVLASSINIGLLNPNDIIEKLMKKHQKNKIPMNSLEGYLRQLFWREYQRYCYIYFDFKKNYFGNKKKLTKEWYTGNLNVPPVDNCIIKGFDSGYLHHIERLMIIGNFMNLSNINPQEGFKWFMEFSCDSYEWVMHQNVLEMVFFASGGETMKRPYISSSNYILKMSNYEKGDWCQVWNDKYHNFIKKNKSKLLKFRYYVKL